MRIGSSLVGGWLLLAGGIGVVSCGDDDSPDPSSEAGGSGATSGSGGSGKGGGTQGGDTGDDGGTAGVPGSGGSIGGEGGGPVGGQGGEAGAIPVGGEGGTGEPPDDCDVDACYDDDPCTADVCAGQSCTNEAVVCSTLKGGGGGTAYTDLCPGGEVVIGYEGRFNDSISGSYPLTVTRLATICGALTIPDSDGPVTVGETTTLPLRGSINTATFSRRCPTDHVVVGFGGSAIGLITDLVVHCAPLSVTSGQISVGASTPLAELNTVDNIGTFSPVNCPSDQIAKGSAIRAGDVIDAFGLVCESLPEP